jgi:hypothetical protein
MLCLTGHRMDFEFGWWGCQGPVRDKTGWLDSRSLEGGSGFPLRCVGAGFGWGIFVAVSDVVVAQRMCPWHRIVVKGKDPLLATAEEL